MAAFGFQKGLGLLYTKEICQLVRPLSLYLPLCGAVPTVPVRKRNGIPNRHWNPAFKKARNWKVLKVDLPDYDWDRARTRGDVPPEKIRERMKKAGLMPMANAPPPTYISSFGVVLDKYVPPEGDGKASKLSRAGMSQGLEGTKGWGKTKQAVRKIRKYEDDFRADEWVEEAESVYKAAHEALAEGDEDKMHQCVTELAFPEMMLMANRKTIRWNFIKTLEPPLVVQARCAEMASKDNMFGQLTVRMHTQQTLAVYDRFGRLIHGSETVAKDVLEFVVFEKHLSNTYGTWRLHAKIVPEWLPAREPGRLTYRVPEEKEEEEVSKESEEAKDRKEEEEEEGGIFDKFGRRIFGKK